MSSTSTAPSNKIPFTVIYSSSHEDGYPASELSPLHASEHTRGWQSARFAEFPQKLVLKFDKVYHIRKIQILSHQAKIATSIEVYYGICPDGSMDDAKAVFTRLGYLSLDSNERSSYKARELKSVYVNARGSYLKLIIKKCHINTINVFNQVGIIAINVVGATDQDGGAGSLAGGVAGLPANVISDELSQLQLNTDEKTARTIQELLRRKDQAIQNEDYDEAKRLKLVIDQLKQVGSRLAELEAAKAQAVRAEDYDRAKQIKIEIDRVRQQAADEAHHIQTHGTIPSKQVLHQHQGHHHQLPQDPQEIPIQPRGQRGAAAGAGGFGPASVPTSAVAAPVNPAVLYGDERPIHGVKAYQQQFQPDEASPPRQGQSGNGHMSRAASKGTLPAASARGKKGPSYGHDEPPHPHPHPHDDHGHVGYDDRPLPAASASKRGAHANVFAGDDGFGPGSGQNSGQASPVSNYQPRISAADERPLPIHKNKGGAAGGGGIPAPSYSSPDEHPPEDDHDAGEMGEEQMGGVPQPEPLSAANRKQAEPLIDVYGLHTVECLFSKHWSLRQSALRTITDGIASGSLVGEHDYRELMSTCSRVLKRGLADKVAQVFSSATLLLETAVNNLVPHLKPDEARTAIEPVVTAMIENLGSSNVRSRQGAHQILLYLSFHKHLNPGLVSHALLAPLSKRDKGSPLPLKSRARLLMQLLLRYGLSDALGLSLSTLMKQVIVPEVSNRDQGVRDAVIDMAALITKLAGKAKCEPFLKQLRPGVLDTLKQRYDDLESGKLEFHLEENTHRAHVEPSTTTHTNIPYTSSPVTHHTGPAKTSTRHPGQHPPAAAAHPGAHPHPHAHSPPISSSNSPASAHGHAQHPQTQLQQPHSGRRPHYTDPDYGSAPATDASFPVHHTGMGVGVGDSVDVGASGGMGMGMSMGDEVDTAGDGQGFCQFCGAEDPSFTEEKLDLHYWQDCPMLTSCKQCEQVIEIPTLNEHLLSECEVTGTYQLCQRCREPIPTQRYQQHSQQLTCTPARPLSEANRCPLCHLDIPAGEEGWKQHLLEQGCPMNTRTNKEAQH